MIAHLYIVSESFVNNNALTEHEIEVKIQNLSVDIALIRKHKETNRLYTNYGDIFSCRFYGEYTVGDFICKPLELKSKGVDRDIINAIGNIFCNFSQDTPYTSEDVIQVLLPEVSESECYGIIAFNKIQNIDENFQIIYGIDGWYKFRRYFLSLYPKGPEFFIEECSIYFPQLFFHQRNIQTVGAILDDCPKKIVYHLTALNDEFRASQGEGRNRSEVLRHFSSASKLDEPATLEGNAQRRSELTFQFENEVGEVEGVYCEPHLKLCYNDDYPGDTSYSNDRRIYFHEGRAKIHQGRILIGHIGKHL